MTDDYADFLAGKQQLATQFGLPDVTADDVHPALPPRCADAAMYVLGTAPVATRLAIAKAAVDAWVSDTKEEM